MDCSCVRQTDLPHTSKLFADYLYHPERVAAFYRFPVRDSAAYAEAARAADLPLERRAALVAALAPRNPSSLNLLRLAQPGTVAVVTGQQVGLFSGPCYSVYKALTAACLARRLNESGIPAVPVFWLATEDHDFAEVNQAWVFDRAHQPVKLELKRSSTGQPVGEVPLPPLPLSELRAALDGLPFGEEVAGLVEQCYRPGVTMGQAFSELLSRLLAEYDLVRVDPMLPAMRELAAPALRVAVEAAPGLTQALLTRGRDLAAAGYHAQVHVEEHTSLVFLLEGGLRQTLRRHGDDYICNGRRVSARELGDRAASLSPSALLRPVIQDSILPTVAYVGGPAELAYLAQSQVIYDAILGRMPVAVPRAGFTVLDARSHRLLERYGLHLPDFYHGEMALRERLATALVPPAVTAAVGHTASTVGQELDRLREVLLRFDPTLTRAIDRGTTRIRYQVGKIERKVAREALRRDARATQDAASLYGLLYPERHLQERLYSILPFLAKHGLDLIARVYDNVCLDSPDHRVLVV